MSLRAAALVGVVALSGCSALPADPVPPTSAESLPSPAGPASSVEPGSADLRLDFDGRDPLAVSGRGSTFKVRREGDAPVRTTRGGDGTRALVFPPYAASGEQRLVLLVPGGASPKQPSGSVDLAFGADVEIGDGLGSGPNDNGDNVVQRGLYADQDQFKLQVDKHVPSCTVRTPRLRAFVGLGHKISGGWYRLSCQYDGATLKLTATTLGGVAADSAAASVPANAGALSFSSSTDISIGGKVTSDGALVTTQPDQFNGALDNVFVSTEP